MFEIIVLCNKIFPGYLIMLPVQPAFLPAQATVCLIEPVLF